jgi:hypothetical protein
MSNTGAKDQRRGSDVAHVAPVAAEGGRERVA